MEPMIIAHLHFLHAYCQTWWLPHFLWNKHIDPRTKQPGFLARHMAVRYYVQSRDLDDLMQNWSTNPFFKNFIDSFPQNEEYAKEELAKKFFKRAKDRHDKHFRQWKQKYLHLMLLGEPFIARLGANWILGKATPQTLPTEFYSHTHKTNISL